jgi:DNA-binding GntR family transcriptional regulator
MTKLPRRKVESPERTTFDWLPIASRTLSLSEQIAEQISNAIIKGFFEPGHRIQEQEVADRFEVSRGPVREALRILEKDGMVQIIPRRGAQVTRLNVEEVNDIFEIRISLFGLASRLFAERPNGPALQRLKADLDRIQGLTHDGLADDYVSTVYRMNMAIADASGNTHLRNMMFSLAHQTLRYSRLGLSSAKRRQQSAKNWSRLYQALLRKDARAAQQAAELLVTQSRDMAVRLLREQADRRLTASRHPQIERGS